jgi:hypothetical protein
VRFNWHNLIGFAFAGLLVSGGALESDAGLVHFRLDDAPLVTSECSTMASSPAQPLPAVPPTLDRNVPGVVGLHTPGSTMTGQGSSITSSGSSAPAAMVPATADSSPGSLLAYRLAKPGLALPVPFLDGVFRPPRG